MPNMMEFFNNLETETSEQETEHSQEVELEEPTEDAQTSEEEEHSGEDLGTVEDEEQQDEEVQEEQENRLFAGRYKSIEDLEKAYKSLQARYTKDNQLMKDLQQLNNPQQQLNIPQYNQTTATSGYGLPQANTPIPQELATNPQFVHLANTNPSLAMQTLMEYQKRKVQQEILAPVQDQMKNMQMQMEIMNLRTSTPDFNDVAEDLPAIFNQNPWLWGVPSPVETAYKLAKANRVDNMIGQATESVRQEAVKTKQQKKSAMAERQQAKTPPKKTTPEEDIMREIFEAGGKTNSVFF